MSFYRIKSLQHRLFLCLLLPVTGLLIVFGYLSFLFAKNIILNQWREVSILNLQRTARNIDERLKEPLEWINKFNNTDNIEGKVIVRSWILEQLKQANGIYQVLFEGNDTENEIQSILTEFSQGGTPHVHSTEHHATIGKEAVIFSSFLKDKFGNTIGTLKIKLHYNHLIEHIRPLGWRPDSFAGIVDNTGLYLTHTVTSYYPHTNLGKARDPLSKDMFEAIKGGKPFGTFIGPGLFPEKVGGFYRLENAPWTIVVFVDSKHILKPVIQFRFFYFLAGTTGIFLIIFLVRSILGKQIKKIKEVTTAANNVANGDYGKPLPVISEDELGRLTRSFNTMVKGLKERDFLSNTFGKYVDPKIARKLMKRPEAARLGGEKREVAILMSDIRNFIKVTKTLSPEDTLQMLNLYFKDMIEVIRKHQGIIVDFYGDAILIFFDPIDLPIEKATHHALECGFEMQKAVKIFNGKNREKDLPDIHIGAAINTGEVIVGNIGSSLRAKYGIVGTPVNIAHRLQAYAKAGELLLSKSAYNYVKDRTKIIKTLNIKVKGLSGKVEVYIVQDK